MVNIFIVWMVKDDVWFGIMVVVCNVIKYKNNNIFVFYIFFFENLICMINISLYIS